MGDNTNVPRFALELRGHRVVSGSALPDVLAAELLAAGIERFLLVTSRELAPRFDAYAGEAIKRLAAGRFTATVPHVPESSVVDAVRAAQSCEADGLLALGGGSVLDTAKAVSDRLGLPIIAVPTNFSGSEVTWNFGLTADGVKQTVRNPKVLPRTVVYDPSLLDTLPRDVAVCSGVNAIAHAIEAMYAPQANAFTHALAEMGIRKLVSGLQRFVSNGASGEAAAECLAGSWLCGEVLSQVGMGLHHRICHVLGGTYGLPHAQAHTVLLPYSIEWNFDYAPALACLVDLLPGRTLGRGLAEFSARHGAPRSLRALGLTNEQIPDVAAAALSTPVTNPRPTTVADVHTLLSRAFNGDLAPEG